MILLSGKIWNTQLTLNFLMDDIEQKHIPISPRRVAFVKEKACVLRLINSKQ